jgi:CO/xanthine dehydrogenase FAD-binding subunit
MSTTSTLSPASPANSLVVSPTLADALQSLLLGARPVAGGTDLVVGARQGKKPLPAALVAIHRLAELHSLSTVLDDGTSGVRMGALTTHAEIVAHPLIRERFTGLCDASSIVGCQATRATGTIGGNVMTASPAMDTGAPLLCLDAAVVLASVRGTRRVLLNEFFVGPGKTVAEADELLVAIEIPDHAGTIGSCYVRLEYRQQMEIAVVGAGAFVQIENGLIVSARVAVTALAPAIKRIAAAEDTLIGTSGDRASVDAAAEAAAAATAPISDVRATADYRKAMAKVIARRAISGALARANGEVVEVPATSSLQGTR